MSGLSLKTGSGRTNKSKHNSSTVTAIDFPGEFRDRYVCQHARYEQFFTSSKADNQLAALKVILDELKESPDDDVVNFLVIVFLQALVKHPVKCFLTRHITKTFGLQQPFSTALSSEICSITSQDTNSYRDYSVVIMKLGACIENFPTGVVALRMCEIEVARYLKESLNCCMATLRHTDALPPTEKHEIFILAHSSLRLLLHIIQRVSPHNTETVTSNFTDISACIQYLLGDDDTPMDTKSVCGILLLTMFVLEHGDNSWVRILDSTPTKDSLKDILLLEAARLSLYSAIVTVVPIARLQGELVEGDQAVVVLTNRILGIGDRTSSDGALTLTVARTILVLAKLLPHILDRAAAQRIVEPMLVFIWSHLEHHMDSVRHLSAQALGCVVRYSSQLDKEGDDKALTALFGALSALDPTRKSYFLCISALTQELGAGVMLGRVPGLSRRLLEALGEQQLQARATAALEFLLSKHVQQSNTADIYTQWIQPIIHHVATKTLDSVALGALENLLAKIVMLDDRVMEFILPYIKETSDADLKCILLLLSVARKSGVLTKLEDTDINQWKGMIEYEVLNAAAVDSVDETRILALSLIVESAKSTEKFTVGDFNFILHYLKYNINTQSPNFRQLTLSNMKKFINRLSDSYKVIKRLNQTNGHVNHSHYYLEFIEKLRQQCFDSLIQGANYSRRYVALQILTWIEHLDLDGYSTLWKEQYVEKMLLHLEDSYENNKEYALKILDKCPIELLESKKYTISLDIEDIVRQASSVKPTECPSAAYKLKLVLKKLPHRVLDDEHRGIPSPAAYSALSLLLRHARAQLATAHASILEAAARAPMYGVLHVARRALTDVDAGAISASQAWTDLIAELMKVSFEVSAVASLVVNNSSPEGHLPMDKVPVTEQGVPNGVTLGDGSQVTAQMVLLCAWRSVKEVSLLLGCISSRLSIAGESGAAGTLSPAQLLQVGEQLTALLAQTKHRGAFEQAHVGFTMLAARLWRCREPGLSSLPSRWLASLMRDIAGGEGALCATRRSAGVPFMIQALVTTELQVNGHARCFHACITTLLQMAHFDPAVTYTPAQVSARTHALNILRALFRGAALAEASAPHVAAGLLTAVRGFDARTWSERNSATLLFSALTVRVFGVPRSRDSERLCARNTMTGRVFFLRYPLLYDHMLERLREVSVSADPRQLRPSLYPILLLLARLYPSALEGTVSNLKLVAFVPHVLSCASSCVLKTRQLAAKAMVPLISPEQYLPHIAEMFNLLSNKAIKRNFCHGILLQLVRLLDAKPTSLTWSPGVAESLERSLRNTLWVLEQASGAMPCYLLADEYVKTVNLILWRFPSLISDEMLQNIQVTLGKILFRKDALIVSSGKEVCLANSLYLSLVIRHRSSSEYIPELVIKGLLQDSYDVVLAALNYLLILNDKIEAENVCKFLEHLSEIPGKYDVLNELRGSATYLDTLRCVLKTNKYQECVQKTFKVLSLEKDTQRIIVGDYTNNISDEEVVTKLLECLNTEHENLRHIYLNSLLNFITEMLTSATLSKTTILNVIRTIYSFGSSENSDIVRQTVVGFLRDNYQDLLNLDLEGFSKGDKFEYQTTILAIIVNLLEDDNDTIRQTASDIVLQQQIQQKTTKLLPSKAAEILRDYVESNYEGEERLAMFVVICLLDFKSEVTITDDSNEECRVFDQNERYNIFLEETIWTNKCADKVNNICNLTSRSPIQSVQNVVQNSVYRETIVKLCNNNFRVFEELLLSKSTVDIKNDIVNPKIGIFISKLGL